MPHKDPAKRKRYMTAYRSRPTQIIKERARKVVSGNILREKKREILTAAKDKPCADCGNSYHFCVMDFDHVRGEKLFELSRTKLCDLTVKIHEEIAKCDVVCANCHRIRTYLRSQGVEP